MQLVPLMRLTATIGTTMPIGNTHGGNRVVANVSGGHFAGERLSGQVLASGADWVVIDPDGFGHVDVRLVLRTDDDANIYVHYTGLLEYNDAVSRAFREGVGTEPGATYFVTHLRFETGSEKYRWLNHRLAIAEGRLLPGGVEYQVYEMRAG